MKRGAEILEMFPKPKQSDATLTPPDWLEEDWLDFVESRKQIKKPMTEIAQRRMLRKIARCEETHDRATIRQMLDDSMVNGWQNIYPENYPQKGAQRPQEARQTRAVTRADIERNARPGETYEQCETRLKRERGIG